MLVFDNCKVCKLDLSNSDLTKAFLINGLRTMAIKNKHDLSYDQIMD